MFEKTILTESAEQTACLFGAFDENIKIIENEFDVLIKNRDTEKTLGNALIVSGENEENVLNANKTLLQMQKMSRFNNHLTPQNVEYIISMIKSGEEGELADFGEDCICVTSRGKPIKAKTVGQKQYVSKIKNNTVVFGVGPAGTGKTFLAVAMAVTALRAKEVERIILTRPAVEAGERLGFLPGDLQNKIDPYLRPLYDALYEMFGAETYQRHLERGTIEIAPLAYMRGRTLDDAFIILDEAQNTSPEQMKMFLTRLGYNSKAVITGDITQTDLPYGKKSGLIEAVKILDGIDDISILHFTERDVVRHRLVQKIISAYEKYQKERKDQIEKERPRRFYNK